MVIEMYNHSGINREGPRIGPCGIPFDNGDVVFLFSENVLCGLREQKEFHFGVQINYQPFESSASKPIAVFC